MKISSKILLSTITANLLIIAMSGCSGGSSKEELDDSVTQKTVMSIKNVKVYQGELIECRVADDNGHVASEESASNYLFTYPQSENLGKITAEDCKEKNSNLRYDFTMKLGTDGIISAFTTLKIDYPSIFQKIEKLSGFSEFVLLGNFSGDNNSSDMLRLANLIALMYDNNSLEEFKTKIDAANSLASIYDQAYEALVAHYNGQEVDSFKSLLEKIESEKIEKEVDYFKSVKASKKQAKALQKAPSLDITALAKIGLTIVDVEGKGLADVNIKVDANIVNAEGKSAAKEFLTSPEGSSSFYIKQAINGDNLILVTLKKDGFLDSGFQLDPSDFTETFSKIVQMIPLDAAKLPSGVALKQEKISAKNVNSDGSLNSDIVLTVENETKDSNDKSTATNLKVTIPNGVQLLDENKEPITGALTTSVVSFGVGDNNASGLESFPGGFQVRVGGVPDENGTAVEDANVTFQSAGFTSIQIKDENGNKVKNFSGEGVEIAMEVKKDTFNPATNKTIAIGDEVPIWHYNEDTGKWGYEELGKVQDISKDDVYGVVFKANHLTYFNLDWHNGDVCKTRVNIIDEDTNETIKGISTQIRVVTPSSICGSNNVKDNKKDGFFDIENVPRDETVTFEVSYKGSVLASTKTTLSNQGTFHHNKYGGAKSYSGCSVDVVVPHQVVPVPVKKSVTVYEQCSDGTKKSALSNVMVYSRDNYYRYLGQTDAQGIFTVEGSDSEDLKGYSYYSSSKHKSRSKYYTIASDQNKVDVVYTLRNKYCATPSNQVITIGKQQIGFNGEDGTSSESPVTIVKSKDSNWEKVLYKLSRVVYNTIEENINLDKMKNVRNSVVAVNIRKTTGKGFNINTVFTGVDVNQRYRLTSFGDKYVMFISVEDEADMFVNGKIDKWSEMSSFVKNDYTGTWVLNPFYLLKSDLLDKEEFEDAAKKLQDNLEKEGTFEITLMFSDDIALKDFYAKGLASKVMDTKYKRIVEPMCQGKSDCTIKYFTTTLDMKNAK